MLSFGWAPLALLFSILLIPLSILWWLHQVRPLQWVSPSLSCSIAFSDLLPGPGIYLSFRFLSILPCGQPGWPNQLLDKFSFFSVNITWSGRLAQMTWSICISKSQRSHSSGQILGCAHTIRLYDQILPSCTITSGSPCPPVFVSSFSLFVLAYYIHLLCNWSFHLYHCLISICYFLVSFWFDIVSPYGVVLCGYEKR